MSNVVKKIELADDKEIEKLLKAVLKRWDILFPNLEISVICLEKNTDRKKQLDRIIQVLQKMKETL